MVLLCLWLIVAGVVLVKEFEFIPYIYHPYFHIVMVVLLVISFILTVLSQAKISQKSIVLWISSMIMVILQATPAIRHFIDINDFSEALNTVIAFINPVRLLDMFAMVQSYFSDGVEVLDVLYLIYISIFEVIKFALLVSATIFTIIALIRFTKKKIEHKKWLKKMKEEGLAEYLNVDEE